MSHRTPLLPLHALLLDGSLTTVVTQPAPVITPEVIPVTCCLPPLAAVFLAWAQMMVPSLGIPPIPAMPAGITYAVPVPVVEAHAEQVKAKREAQLWNSEVGLN